MTAGDPAGETGAAAVWLLTVFAVVALVAGTGVALAQAAAARRTAETAADLAALAAAQRVVDGTRQACDAAARVAAVNDARLLRCRLAGPVADVAVAADPAGWLRHLGPARAVARAGPVAP